MEGIFTDIVMKQIYSLSSSLLIRHGQSLTPGTCNGHSRVGLECLRQHLSSVGSDRVVVQVLSGQSRVALLLRDDEIQASVAQICPLGTSSLFFLICGCVLKGRSLDFAIDRLQDGKVIRLDNHYLAAP